MSSKRAAAVLTKGNFSKYKWYLLDSKNNKIGRRSSYEVTVWNYYNSINSKILYEPKTFVLNKKSRCTPGFLLEDENVWIEIKGTFSFYGVSVSQFDKIEKLKNNDVNIRVLYLQLCGLKYKTSKSYFDNAKGIGVPIEDYLGLKMYYDKEHINAYEFKTLS